MTGPSQRERDCELYSRKAEHLHQGNPVALSRLRPQTAPLCHNAPNVRGRAFSLPFPQPRSVTRLVAVQLHLDGRRPKAAHTLSVESLES